MTGAVLQASALAMMVLLQIPGANGDLDRGSAGDQSVADGTAEVSASAGLAPDTVTVGDHFRVRVRVSAPAGAIVEFPSFRLVEPVEGVDTLQILHDPQGGWTATYTLAAWTVSDSLVGTFPFRVTSAQGNAHDYRVRVHLPIVRSVLPADSSLHVPKPARAVIPLSMPAPISRDWVTAVILLLVAVAGIAWFILRRRGPLATTPPDPRAAALAALDEIDRERLLERGLSREYHFRTSRVLRGYIQAQGGGGEDLTTTELLSFRRRAREDDQATAELARLLRQADRVKFSAGDAAAAGPPSQAHGEAVRQWIRAWPARRPGESGDRAEAA